MSNVSRFTIGVDLGDKQNVVCVLDGSGEILEILHVTNTQKAMKQYFSQYSQALVALEAGSHSPWVSRLLEKIGCTVLVGNARKLRAIWQGPIKTDFRDAEMLARIARFDPNLLYPIKHRDEQSQEDLSILKSRDMLVKNRTDLINHVRGVVKSMGQRLPSCSAESFHKRASEHLPERLRAALMPIVEQIQSLTASIKGYDRHIEELSRSKYPETEALRQIKGVGPITALAFVLTLEDPKRFQKSREVGAFLGLIPRRDQSGDTDKHLKITKSGNAYLRRLLVGCAQYILGPFGPDCDLKRFGLRLCGQGGKKAKRRAVTAVARKLAVLLHRLWATGEVYEPLYNQKQFMQKAA
jgi:transposase